MMIFARKKCHMRTRRSSAASVTSTTLSKSRESRRQKKKGKIRAGSPDEELALVEHLKGMAMASGTRRELKSLLSTLLLLGMEETARKLQYIGERFQLSHLAAVKLTEDATSTDIVDDQSYSLEHYIKAVKNEDYDPEVFSWRSKMLHSQMVNLS